MFQQKIRKSLFSLILQLGFLLLTVMGAPGQEVSPGGAFTYQYAIKVPDGTNGMAPQLALNYNSRGPNGITGMGFNLSGFSAITRDSSYKIGFDEGDHFLYNGQPLVYSDPAVGGDGTYHTAKESFQKIEAFNINSQYSYWTVTQKNGMKLYFGYTSGDHLIENDGHIDAKDQSGKARLWCLSKVEDLNGNSYIVKYIEDAADYNYYPERVIYTLNDAGMNLYKTVYFTYEDRSDDWTLFIPGNVTTSRRLKWITVKTGTDIQGEGGNPVRKYELSYENTGYTKRSRLTSIREYGSDGTLPPSIDVGTYSPGAGELYLPEVAFSWTDGNKGSTDYDKIVDYPVVGYYNRDSAKYFTGDFNGDGRSDLIGWYQYTDLRSRIFHWPGTDSGLRTNYAGVHFYYPDEIKRDDGEYFTGDFNGDGKTDLMGWFFDSSDGSSQMLGWFGSDSGLEPYTVWKSYAPGHYYKPAAIHYTGDFNGDGRTDLIGLFKYGNGDTRIFGWLGTDTGLANYSQWKYLPVSTFKRDSSEFFIGDYNGDGRSDLMCWYTNPAGTYDIMGWHGSDSGLEDHSVWRSYTPGQYYKSKANHYTGDFNGDGKTDLIGWLKESDGDSRIHGWFGNSTGLTYKAVWQFIPASSFNRDSFTPYMGDFNGDGKTDMLGWYTYSDGDGRLYAWYGNEDGLRAATGITGRFDVTDSNLKYHRYPMDTTGDGISEMVIFKKENGYSELGMWNWHDEKGEVLNEIKAQGQTLRVSYEAAPQMTGAVNPDLSAYPETPNKGARLLVSRLETEDGLGLITASTYEYEDGLLYSGGGAEKANLGFRLMRKIDPDGSSIVTYYRQDKPYNGLVEKTEKYGSEGKLYTIMRKEYSKISTIPGVEFIFRTDAFDYGYYNGDQSEAPVVSWQEFSPADGSWYDASGNNIEFVDHGEVTETGGVITEDTDQLLDNVRKVFEYTTLSCGATVPAKSTIYAYDLDDNVSISAEEIYAYEGTPGERGLMTKKSARISTTPLVYAEATYEYDAYGNRINTKDSRFNAGDFTGYTSQAAYDANYHGQAVSRTDALGRTTIFGYDNLLRHITTTNINGGTKTSEYDIFGRVVKTLLPGDSSSNPAEKVTYYEPVLDSFNNVLTPGGYEKETKIANGHFLFSYSYFDGAGRKIQEKRQGDSGWITNDYYYDTMGRPYKESVPYETVTSAFTARDTAQKCRVKEFDSMGRAVKSINTDGSETRTIYKRKKVISINGKNKAASKEYIGNTAIESVYTGTYTDGDPLLPAPYSQVTTKETPLGTEITDTAGNKTVITRDLLGRNTGSSTPDMGTWSYTNDLNGNLISQTDAEGNTIGFEYDALNRVTKKILPDSSEVIYSYDGTDPGGLGRLVGVVTPSGSETYEYDSLGRIITFDKNIDGFIRSFEYTYDCLDRILTEVLPDGEVLTYSYGTGGELESVVGVKNGITTNYATDMTYTALGKLKEITYGNGTTTSYSYYDDSTIDPENENRTHSYNLKGFTTLNGSGQIIAQTEYQYDGAGNIIKKNFTDDFAGSYYEIFGYDDLSRLTSVDSDLYTDRSYVYNNNDNIQTKEGNLYLYNYSIDGKSLPHAVSEIQDPTDGSTLFTYEYDRNGNMTRSTGHTKITIRAKGNGIAEEPPIMDLRINGEKLCTWVITNSDYHSYTWHGYWDGTSSIDVIFTNDNTAGGVDTSITVDWIEVNGVTVESESANVNYDRGFYYSGCVDGFDVVPGQELMDLEGALRYTVTGAAPFIRQLDYNGENKLVGITETSGANITTSYYSYDDNGERIKKVENGITTYYFTENYQEVWESGLQTEKVKYYIAGTQRIAQRVTRLSGTDELLYYHSDHLSSAVRLTDEAGTPIQSIVYDPYGKVVYRAGTNEQPYQFTDQEYDKTTGLYYYGARYYDPNLGRFLQADTVMDGLNRYAYCRNNPLTYTDPTGHFTWDLTIAGFTIFNLSTDNGFHLGIDTGLVNFEIGYDSEGFYLGAGVLGLIGGYIEIGQNGVTLASSSIIHESRIDINQNGFTASVETIFLVGVGFSIGKETGIYAYTPLVSFKVSTKEAYIYTLAGGAGYSFEHETGYTMAAGSLRCFGLYGGPGWKDGNFIGEADYQEGINSDGWIDPMDAADELFKTHDIGCSKESKPTIDQADAKLIKDGVKLFFTQTNRRTGVSYFAKGKGLAAAGIFSLLQAFGRG